ncbi:MAG: hypothetical protein H7831_14715 [Magnetococcus sp. WYHC-3]
MFYRGSKVQTKGSSQWYFEKIEKVFSSSKLEHKNYKTFEYPNFKVVPTKVVDVDVSLCEDFVRISTSDKKQIICTSDEVLMTVNGPMSVEALILDFRSHTEVGRIRLCTVTRRRFLQPVIIDYEPVGYGEGYDIKINSHNPLVVNNFLVCNKYAEEGKNEL